MTCSSSWNASPSSTSRFLSDAIALREQRVAMGEQLERYLILSSDAHAGAPLGAYRDYLESQWHDEFDQWLAAVVNPWHDVNDTTNWDSDDRIASMDAEGVCGEVLFPNTLPPFYDIQTHLAGVP